MSRRFAWVLSLAVVAIVAWPGQASAGAAASAGVDKFDLAQLADGETRVFGEGEKSVTATRKGEVVTIAFSGKGGESKSMECAIGRDSCYVMTTDKSGHGNVVFVGDAGHKGGAITAVVTGDGAEGFEGEGGEFTWTSNEEAGEGAHVVRVMRMKHGEGTVLRCPEGDTTMTLKKDEANTGYRCPKHNLALAEVKDEPHKVVRIERHIETK